jgi:hypothetical protein
MATGLLTDVIQVGSSHTESVVSETHNVPVYSYVKALPYRELNESEIAR